ncbi:hypothetical protein B9G98_03042 [Wickerhamiella sorbophila]|uniref:Uncharacterized protein n=1 Tax=Wickerhamiella sorbophila TaxID=45607 RepID=A0A2T0FKB2_9ASCO|nr:hypothetical protein B9G98_03042 [Wickerhamiella sorbophila]PRT55422.1 hypothetical protein B9G98_03042 [Wickerhamiella sorbophila]
MRLKQRLKALVDGTLKTEVTKRQDFREDQKIRQQIKERMTLQLPLFCSSRPEFDGRHGLVYKLLKSSPQRLKNGVLTTHDMMFWLRQKKIVPALWIVKLAGPHVGQVPRNQLLQWLGENNEKRHIETVLKWTKKWGIKDNARSAVIASDPKTVAEARSIYKATGTDKKSRQILGNALLKKVVTYNADEVYAFYKSLNKDVRTFQTMFAGMFKNPELMKYREEIWETVNRHSKANNLVIDSKLKETYEATAKLTECKVLAGQPS